MSGRKGKEFSKATKVEAWRRCKDACEKCGALLKPGRYDYDHVIPIAQGGDNTLRNCEVLCEPCHDEKSDKKDKPNIAKAKRREAKQVGAETPSKRGFKKEPKVRDRSDPFPNLPKRQFYKDKVPAS